MNIEYKSDNDKLLKHFGSGFISNPGVLTDTGSDLNSPGKRILIRIKYSVLGRFNIHSLVLAFCTWSRIRLLGKNRIRIPALSNTGFGSENFAFGQ